jgi:hypothetical protein
MKPFANIEGKLYYSRRPPISHVMNWERVYDKHEVDNWRGLPNSHVSVFTAGNIPHYYKVVVTVGEDKKVTKYFYGELAYNNVRRFLGDFGHTMEENR